MGELEASTSQLGSDPTSGQVNLRTFARRPRPAAAKAPPPTATGLATTAAAAEPAAKRPRLSVPAPKPKKRLTQTHLDLGQRNFHSTQCPTCGLIYTPGKPEDDRLHAAYHNKSGVVPRYVAAKGDATVAADGAAGDIVRVTAAKPSKMLRDLVEVLEVDLGLVPGWLLSVPSATAFLYVCRKTRGVLGCVVAENITEAWEATMSSRCGSEEGQEDDRGSGVVIVDRAASRRTRHGVRMMWTAAAARRRNIATKLLDCARCQLVRGYVVPRGELAFSQPTSAGAAFIQAYAGASKFLVYDANNGDPSK